MAFKLALSAVETGIGVDAPNAYHRLANIVFPDSTNNTGTIVKVEFDVQAWYNKGARDTPNAHPLLRTHFTWDSFDNDSPLNTRVQIYNYLKTLPQYAGAVDVGNGKD